MARELIVHIGLPKTGSTALQTFFSRNYANLLKHSIDYLPIGEFKEGEAGLIASGNGAYLARSMLPPNDPAYLSWDQNRISGSLRAAIDHSKASTLLLSSELFALPNQQAWANILKLCEECDLKLSLLAVVRNQCDWLSSAYLQDVKRRQVTRDPAEYIRQLYRSTGFLKYHTYFSAMARLTNGSIKLVSFDQYALNNNLIAEVLAKLGIVAHDIPVAQAPINVSPSAEEIAFLRVCNLYKPSMNFSDILASAVQSGSHEGSAPRRWTVVDSLLAREVQRFFGEEIQLLMTNFGLGGGFFSNPCAEYIDLAKIDVGSEKMVSLLAQYLVSYDTRLRSLNEQVRILERRLLALSAPPLLEGSSR